MKHQIRQPESVYHRKLADASVYFRFAKSSMIRAKKPAVTTQKGKIEDVEKCINVGCKMAYATASSRRLALVSVRSNKGGTGGTSPLALCMRQFTC